MSIDSYPSDKKLDLKVNLTKETQIPNQSREMQWLLVILFVALLMYIVTFNNFIVGLWQDDATYIILAKSLISGQGYRMINQVGKPLGKHYPIGYPLLLAPFVGLFPNSFAPLKILSLVCMLASSILLYTYSRKRLGTEYALFTTALFALNPHIIGYSSAVMAEAPYILMMLATVLMVDMYANHQKIRGKGIMGTFFGPGITYLVKTIGLAFLPATPLYLIHKKHARKAILAFIAFMIIAGLWAYRNFTKTESLVSSRYEKVMEVHYGDQDTLLSTLKGFFVGAINNTWELLTKFMPATMIGFWIEYRFPNSIIILRVISLIITTIILFGFIHQVQKGIGFAEFLIFFATGIALLWPFMYERRVIPYLPFLYVYLVSGIDCVLQVLTKRIDVLTKHKRIVLLILSSALLINAGRGIQGVLRPVRNRLEDISYSANWVQWLNAELPKEAVIMTPYGPSIYLYLNRETLPYPEICDTEFIIEHTKQANFILIQPLLNAPKKFSEYTDNCLRPTIKRAEDIYKLIYEVPDEFIEVYRIEKP